MVAFFRTFKALIFASVVLPLWYYAVYYSFPPLSSGVLIAYFILLLIAFSQWSLKKNGDVCEGIKIMNKNILTFETPEGGDHGTGQGYFEIEKIILGQSFSNLLTIEHLKM